jgi:hypothetical protein
MPPVRRMWGTLSSCHRRKILADTAADRGGKEWLKGEQKLEQSKSLV